MPCLCAQPSAASARRNTQMRWRAGSPGSPRLRQRSRTAVEIEAVEVIEHGAEPAVAGAELIARRREVDAAGAVGRLGGRRGQQAEHARLVLQQIVVARLIGDLDRDLRPAAAAHVAAVDRRDVAVRERRS